MNSSKKRLYIYVLLALILLLGIIQSCTGPKQELRIVSELIPREVIFGNPERVLPRLSPDGTLISFVAPVNDILNVWVGTMGADDARPVTKDTLRGIYNYFWAADNEHVMYFQDKDGDENWRLYAVHLKSGEIRDLTPYDNVQVQLIGRDKNFPNELLIAMNQRNPQVHDVYHLDLTNGELLPVAENPGNAAAWVADADFQVRAALFATPEAGYNLMVRENDSSSWQKVLTWDSDDALTSGPVGFTKDGKHLYLFDSRDANATRLVELTLGSGEIEVLAADSIYDVVNVIVDPNTYEVQAAIFAKDKKEIVLLDETIRADFDTLQKLSDGELDLVARDDADRIWLVGFENDDGPLEFYSYNRATKEAKHLFDHRPRLNDYKLAAMKPFSFQSRDGLTVHGYITFPPDSVRQNLAMVLNVHGGPWHRDSWGLHPEAQWLANRGYICLQVNFRGSTGYGKRFLNAGDREWAGKMHDDLVDGVQWAIDQGYADPQRIAIFGGSYGGYAALVGATFTPDLFCCAVDVVGVSNLLTFINSIPPYWSSFRDVLYRRIGNPESDSEFLKSRSPLFKADQIKIPMLIGQGANDPRVKQAEAEQIVAAMQENGVDYEYMLFEDEGHGLTKAENRLKFYAAAEKFLATHLHGSYEPTPGSN
ncbi:MAG: S9 family peptidase [bacterium]